MTRECDEHLTDREAVVGAACAIEWTCRLHNSSSFELVELVKLVIFGV